MTLIKYAPPGSGARGLGLRNAVISAPSKSFFTSSGLTLGFQSGTIFSVARGFDSFGNPDDKIISGDSITCAIPSNSTGDIAIDSYYVWIDDTGTCGTVSSRIGWYVLDSLSSTLPLQIARSFYTTGTGVVLSNQGKTVSFATNSWRAARAGTSSWFAGDKRYMEFIYAGGTNVNAGLSGGAAGDLETYPGATSNSFSYHMNGTKFVNGTNSSFGSALSPGDTIGIAYDRSNGRIWASRNGVWQASGDPSSGTNPAATIAGANLDFAVGVYGGSSMFLPSRLRYAPPQGFNTVQNGTHFYLPDLGQMYEQVSGSWVKRNRLFLGEVSSGTTNLNYRSIYPPQGRMRLQVNIGTANTDTTFPTQMGSHLLIPTIQYPYGATGSIVEVGQDTLTLRSSASGVALVDLVRGY